MTVDDYQPKTPFWAHQAKQFLESRDLEYYAVLSEQGTGKSKVLIDTTAYNYACGRVDALLVIAPKGVHRNWPNIEIPTHMPDYVPVLAQMWPKYDKKKLYDPKFKGLRVLAVNFDCFRGEKGKAAVKDFLQTFSCIVIVDESSKIRNPSAARTKEVLKLRDLAVMRRIATGTPGWKPENIWSQFNFLDPEIFGHSFQSHRSRYCEMINSPDNCEKYKCGKQTCPFWSRCGKDEKTLKFIKSKMPRNQQKFFQMEQKDKEGKTIYKNMDELSAIIGKHSSRVLKCECLDLPPKVYKRLDTELSDEQVQLYKQVAKNLITETMCDKEGMPKTITINIHLARAMRLQQIIGGFIQYDENVRPTLIGASWEKVPRLVDMMDSIEEVEGKVIIWAKFKEEIALIHKALCAGYDAESIVQYHGSIKDAQKDLAMDMFQDQERTYAKKGGQPTIHQKISPVRFFIGQAQSGGLGLTLNKAQWMYYYSNLFDYEMRAQSEDRGHRGVMEHKLTISDLHAAGTVDDDIMSALRNHKDVADVITGDKHKFMELLMRAAKL